VVVVVEARVVVVVLGAVVVLPGVVVLVRVVSVVGVAVVSTQLTCTPMMSLPRAYGLSSVFA